VLSRSVGEEVRDLLLGSTLQGVEDDAGLEYDGVGLERSGLEGGDDALSFGELTVRDEPARRLG
jgi:hypothetical protein